MALIDKASDVIGQVLDPILNSIATQEDCNAELIAVRAQIADLERSLQRAKLVRDELSVKFATLPKAAAIASEKVS